MSETLSTILGLIVFIALIVGIVFACRTQLRKKQELERQYQEFDKWLASQNFTVSQKIGGVKDDFFENTNGLLVDIVNQKICKHFEKQIYSFSEITSVEIHKDSILQTSSSSTAKGKVKGGIILPRAKVKGKTKTVSTSTDESTYDVLIHTSNILHSLVIIHCEKDFDAASRACSCIESILANYTNSPKEQAGA